MNRFGFDGKEWVWKTKGERLQQRHVTPTLKFGGGNIMVWGCMCLDGVGSLAKIEDRVTAEAYVQILEHNLVGSLYLWRKQIRNIVFQQDNDPKHTARVTKLCGYLLRALKILNGHRYLQT